MTIPIVDVLLAEDDSADAELILTSLGSIGLAERVQVARDGEEALDFLFCRAAFAQRASAAIPRLVLLDIKLPKVTGFDVLRQLKQHPRTRLIPVVLLTSSNLARDVNLGYELGANSYVQKPVDFGELRDVVRLVGSYWLTLNVRMTSTRWPEPGGDGPTPM